MEVSGRSGVGHKGVQWSIFVSASFSASAALSSGWGALSFFSSSTGLGELLLAAEKENNSVNQSINILWRDPEYTLQMCIWEMEGFGMLNWKQHQWQWLMRKQAVQQATVARNCYPFPTCSHDLSGTAQPILKWGGLTRSLRKVWGREEGVEWQPNTKFLSSLVTNNASKAAKSGKSGQFLTIM